MNVQSYDRYRVYVCLCGVKTAFPVGKFYRRVACRECDRGFGRQVPEVVDHRLWMRDLMRRGGS